MYRSEGKLVSVNEFVQKIDLLVFYILKLKRKKTKGTGWIVI